MSISCYYFIQQSYNLLKSTENNKNEYLYLFPVVIMIFVIFMLFKFLFKSKLSVKTNVSFEYSLLVSLNQNCQ